MATTADIPMCRPTALRRLHWISTMRLSLMSYVRSFQSWQVGLAISRDADELLQFWGPTAYDLAAELSQREDMGLMPSDRPGHWWSVREEIGRRLGRTVPRPLVDLDD